MNQYNEEYYKSVNYVTYLNRKPKYVKHAREIDMLLKSFNLISADSKILDYGCAVGFLIEGFLENGYNNVHGYDISEWAVQQCKSKNINVVDIIDNHDYDLICCLDVLEHMTDDEIINSFSKLNGNMMLVRIPCSTNGVDFHLEVSKVDPTHCNCKTKTQWVELLRKLGYNFFLPINTNTIYDSDGVMCYLCFKENKL
jgi:2-polyprenyl-3-methyl-5-hydroxy-6-metoxy-1,4-benzoquinol methylase